MGVFARIMEGLASQAAVRKTVMIDTTYLKGKRWLRTVLVYPWRKHDVRSIAHRGHGFNGHVPCTLDRPFIGLLHQDGADETGDGILIWNDTYQLGAAFDFVVKLIDGVG